MRRLAQLPEIIMEKARLIKNNKDIHSMGFTCQGRLCKYEGYEDFYEYLWIWTKVEGNRIFTIITVDTDNGHVRYAYKDMYIKKVIDEINNK